MSLSIQDASDQQFETRVSGLSSCIWPTGSSACNASDRDAIVWPWDGILSNVTSNIGTLGVHICMSYLPLNCKHCLGLHPVAADQASHSRACAANG